MTDFPTDKFWRDVLAQDREALPGWFAPEAHINWHCTNERFTAGEYIRANCEYPGSWNGQVQRELWAGDALVTITRVYNADKSISCHVTSVFTFRAGKILSLDEYWADDGPPPQWRQAMGIGDKII